MNAQDIREAAHKVVKTPQYFDLSRVWDGWLLVNKDALQILTIGALHNGCYVAQVWNPARNVVRRVVINAYHNVYVIED